MAETSTIQQLQQPLLHTSRDIPTSDATRTTGIGPTGRRPASSRWRSRATVLALVVAIAANLAIIAVIVGRGDFASASSTPPPVRTLPLVRPMPLAPLAASSPTGTMARSFGEGKFVVGRDIGPGTYRTTGKSGHPDCYWERLKDAGGTTASIIANDLAPGPATVTIDSTDAAFQTRWCNTWTKVS